MSDADLCLLLVDAVVVVALMEMVLLVAWRIGTGQGLPAADLVSNLSAGLCLLGALRGVLSGAAWPTCASWLAAAGIAHAVDVMRRWRAAATLPSADVLPQSRSSSLSP